MEEVYRQLFCLVAFTITGIVIGILFDIFRILRKSFKTTDIITYLQDILFWILTGAILLFSIFCFNNGEIRSYIFIGIVLGIFLYMVTISKFIIKCCVPIVLGIKKVISYPVCFIKKMIQNIIIKPIAAFIKKCKTEIYKKRENMTKNLKKVTKDE